MLTDADMAGHDVEQEWIDEGVARTDLEGETELLLERWDLG